MTIEEKIAALAKFQGLNTEHCLAYVVTHTSFRNGEPGEWKHFNTVSEANYFNNKYPSSQFKTKIYTNISLLPRYFEDLNAVNKLELMLNDDQHITFRTVLSKVVKDVMYFSRTYTSASAAERAEAIGLALDLWQ